MSKENRHVCGKCNSKGFEPSIIPGRCTFCDGTEGGTPPTEQDLAEFHLPPGYAMVPPGTPRAENYKYWNGGTREWMTGWPGGVGIKAKTWRIANPTQNPSDAPDYAALDERNEAQGHLPEGYALEPRGGSRKEGYLYWSTASQMWEPGSVDAGLPIPEGMLVANKLPPNYPPKSGELLIPIGFEVVYGKTPKIHLFRDGDHWRKGFFRNEGAAYNPGCTILKPFNGAWEAHLIGCREGSFFCSVEYGQQKSGEPRYWVVKEGDSALVAGTLVELASSQQFREVVCGDTKYILSLSELEPVELDAARQKEFEKAVVDIRGLKLPEDARQILYTALLKIMEVGR